ncbi:hypothetical protein AVE30378_05624 [Achromobacter veterisilvae]|uniref:Uncharacterized protein n=1 Tax=Achromobacter veterisilvae TaxID=2069367 RepID=A0A446CZG2_9BURK|nr:hypothetical protein [Achromobacter veterisilvae]SSW73262.1 hypothetical protein AVE30378_05624 [Achromobacter veterisilvae]
MTEGNQATKLPADHLKAELRKIGRNVERANFAMDGWDGDELMVLVAWPDGFSARISMGPVASAMIERRVSQCTTLH